jgi:hypothetical protein
MNLRLISRAAKARVHPGKALNNLGKMLLRQIVLSYPDGKAL